MTGAERRDSIAKMIQESQTPVPARRLALAYDVSRQVIVQDIALIRASGYDIISTHRGYMINTSRTVKRVFKVLHTDEQMEEELNLIVDLGGCVENVMINHRVYGHMEAELNINSRKKIALFLEDIKNGSSRPLKNITSGYHYHQVKADSEAVLDEIEAALREKGFLTD